MKHLKKLLINLLLLFYLLLPFEVFAYSDYILAGGQNIGIELNSNGILIVGTYLVNGVDPAKDANLQIGDKIVSINNKAVESIEEMLAVISELEDKEQINITYQRGSTLQNTTLKLITDENQVYKTGLYVKDSINGVGTLTFIDPSTKLYGALGHETIEKTTDQKIEIKNEKI